MRIICWLFGHAATTRETRGGARLLRCQRCDRIVYVSPRSAADHRTAAERMHAIKQNVRDHLRRLTR